VQEVDNQIKVLPLSTFDDRIRLGVLRALYGSSNLSRYSLRPVPAIHIIVERGNVTLEGAVGSELDKKVAFLLANQVHGVFSVTNNLVVDRAS
jgi:osmotically-inducible protein OsmY